MVLPGNTEAFRQVYHHWFSKNPSEALRLAETWYNRPLGRVLQLELGESLGYRADWALINLAASFEATNSSAHRDDQLLSLTLQREIGNWDPKFIITATGDIKEGTQDPQLGDGVVWMKYGAASGASGFGAVGGACQEYAFAGSGWG